MRGFPGSPGPPGVPGSEGPTGKIIVLLFSNVFVIKLAYRHNIIV